MPRKRTGTLLYKPKSGYAARVWAPLKGDDGTITEERRWVPLDTHDRDLATRKLAKIVDMIARGEVVSEEIKREAKREDTYAEYENAFFTRRRAQGIRTVDDEEGVSRRQIRKHLGPMLVSQIRPSNVKSVLQAAIVAGLAKNTVRTIRAIMNRTMRGAWEEEIIPSNPVAKVRVPRMNEVRKAREILSDAEIAQYIASPRAKRSELKLLSLAARTEGGMRTGDLVRWDWSMVDRVDFEACTIPRAKKGQPQRLEIPSMLRPFLRAWWAQHGCPASGPIFPRVRGQKKGQARAGRGVSFANALRRELLRAGVVRHDCDGSCFAVKDPKPCANFKSDPIYNETETSRPVDFHSFRRAFNTALAEAGVNVQQAMHLAGHSDPKVHAMYVMGTRRMQQIPEAALPQLASAGSVTAVTNPDGASNDTSDFQRRGSDSNRRMTVLQTVA